MRTRWCDAGVAGGAKTRAKPNGQTRSPAACGYTELRCPLAAPLARRPAASAARAARSAGEVHSCLNDSRREKRTEAFEALRRVPAPASYEYAAHRRPPKEADFHSLQNRQVRKKNRIAYDTFPMLEKSPRATHSVARRVEKPAARRSMPTF